jgi:hypothetical protein
LQQQARIFPGQISTVSVKVSEDEHQLLNFQTFDAEAVEKAIDSCQPASHPFLDHSPAGPNSDVVLMQDSLLVQKQTELPVTCFQANTA